MHKGNLRILIGVLIAIPVSIALLFVVPEVLSRNRTKGAALRHSRDAAFAMLAVHRAFDCYTTANKTPPASIEQLAGSGCIQPGNEFEPPAGPIYSLRISPTSNWKRLRGVLIRCAGSQEQLASDSIIGIALPDSQFVNATSGAAPFSDIYMVQRDGELIHVNQSQWIADKANWQSRLGGVELW